MVTRPHIGRVAQTGHLFLDHHLVCASLHKHFVPFESFLIPKFWRFNLSFFSLFRRDEVLLQLLLSRRLLLLEDRGELVLYLVALVIVLDVSALRNASIAVDSRVRDVYLS